MGGCQPWEDVNHGRMSTMGGCRHCPGWIDDGDPIVWAENQHTRSFLILRICLTHQNSLEVGSESRNLRFYEKIEKSQIFWVFFFDEIWWKSMEFMVFIDKKLRKTWFFDEKWKFYEFLKILILRIFLKHQNGLEVGSRSRNLRFYVFFEFFDEIWWRSMEIMVSGG